MFTGLIQHLGTVTAASQAAMGATFSLAAGELAARVRIGDSVAVNGVCLTVQSLNAAAKALTFAVSPETLDKCLISEWQAGTAVNLETALTLQTPLGGHLVSGHVDGLTTLIARRQQANGVELLCEVASPLGPFIAHKGSVAINGVSLTSNAVEDCPRTQTTRFTIAVIPHTLANTDLGPWAVGARAHIEVDQIARYIHRARQCAEAE